MRKIIATIAVSMMIGFSFAPSAEATRPIVGYPYTDQCDNFSGVQKAYQMQFNPYYENTATANSNDCLKS